MLDVLFVSHGAPFAIIVSDVTQIAGRGGRAGRLPASIDVTEMLPLNLVNGRDCFVVLGAAL